MYSKVFMYSNMSFFCEHVKMQIRLCNVFKGACKSTNIFGQTYVMAVVDLIYVSPKRKLVHRSFQT